MKVQLKTIIMLLIAVSLGSIAQLMLKMGINSFGQLSDLTSLISAVFTPLVFTGVLLYFLSSLLWLVILSNTELSYAYPFIAVSYVIVALLSYALLNEALPLLRILGIITITAGVAIVSLSK